MGSKVGDNLVSNLFSGATYSQELHAAESKIAELTAEIEQLRAEGKKDVEESKVTELRSTLSSQGIVEIPVVQIDPNPYQPRQTFSQESLTLLARSLESDGQQQPILVFQKAPEKYLLFDGERRWRAARKLGWQEIQSVIVPQPSGIAIDSPESLRRRALLANHHRENINSLDMAEALVKEISLKEGISEREIPRMLNTVIVRLKRQGKLKQLTELTLLKKGEQSDVLTAFEETKLIQYSEKQLLAFLLSLQLNPASISKNIFPALKLYDDLKEAIRKDGLGGHHALILQRLSPENLKKTEAQSAKIRERLAKKILKEKLSVAQSREWVRSELNGQIDEQEKEVNQSVKVALSSLEKIAISNIAIEDLQVLETALKQKLKDIRSLLKSSVSC